MVEQQARLVGALIRLDMRGERGVERPALDEGERLIYDFLRERVAKRPLSRPFTLYSESGRLKARQRCIELADIGAPFDKHAQVCLHERCAGDGCRAQDAPVLDGEPVEARDDNVVHRLRHGGLRGPDQRKFLDEQRIALGPIEQSVELLTVEIRDRRGEPAGVLAVKLAQAECDFGRKVGQRVGRRRRSRRDEDVHGSSEIAHDIVEQLERRFIAKVGVVEDQHDGR